MGWYQLIKSYRFQVCNSILQHLYIVLCAHHLKWEEKWGSVWWGGRGRSSTDWHHFCLKENPQLVVTSELNGTHMVVAAVALTRDTNTINPRHAEDWLHSWTLGHLGLRTLVMSSLWLSLACLLGSKLGSRVQPQVCIYIPLEVLMSGFRQAQRNTTPNSAQSWRKEVSAQHQVILLSGCFL